MAQFLITYHGMGHPTPEMMEASRQAFFSWVETTGGAVTDPGAPVNFVAQLAAGEPAPAAEIAGYTIIQAESLDAARALLAEHPFIARGGTLQISECLGV
ncbi:MULTISPECIES: YciI family protein [Arthrobacter]|uniref:YCII-related domain-containing protein n=1 Tax=Arthrobacter terricola TaxID=2547396 RepID=A0A4R5KHN7_9MICC|nr:MULTISPECIES: YciI family protein [Arthrobacter]MBT8161873.1 YciI family protein [Arthrobacter sp. GN70]TDF94255.1 hypothetical protein E1809_14275 [Arthrobacter terricola]